MMNVSKFIQDHTPLCVCTLGIAILGYMGYHAVKWIINKCHKIEKIDRAAQKRIGTASEVSPASASKTHTILRQESSTDIGDQAQKLLFKPLNTAPIRPAQKDSSKIIGVLEELRSYTQDLTPLQKSCLQTNLIDSSTLQIYFQKAPQVRVTIRRQDIFNSQAQVIVNAANSHLGGGGGIDGAIHHKGGLAYKGAHAELKNRYNSHYILGYAAMIESGLLQQNHSIDNVIVVAGPQGDTSPEKENELYSCYYNSLVLAAKEGKTSIAFPSISTGIFGFPKERAASISLKAIDDFINRYPNPTLKNISIHFLASDPEINLQIYQIAATVGLNQLP